MHESVQAYVQQTLTPEHIHGRRILETGSYDVNGSVRPHLESLHPAKYLGVDTQPGPKVDQVVDCRNLAHQVGHDWDVVISTEMLEHVQDWQTSITQLAAALKPGGQLLITTRSPGFPYHPYPEDHWRYTTTAMHQILAALNLTHIKVESDPQVPGVFALATKPEHWDGPGDLTDIPVEKINPPRHNDDDTSAFDLSVLICSTHTRYDTFGPAISRQIWEQYKTLPPDQQKRIEILMLTDNKHTTLGQKRNTMVDIAQGHYIQFIDDDDRIEPGMFAAILDATTTDADAITFLASVTLNGGPAKTCRYSKDFTDRETPTEYQRTPNHICAIKRELAAKAPFPNLAHGEDKEFAKTLRPHLRTEHHINKILYHYDYHDATTETQQHRRRKAPRRRKQTPLVDVIMLSYAQTPELARMTQQAVNSCLDGAAPQPINMLVLEQQPATTYRRAQTIHAPGTFNYNAYANRGAAMGTAEWIMVANNDLIFHKGWLTALLDADHPVVCPHCPRDQRQSGVTQNTIGGDIGTQFSGWCFMLRRELWERIGGFDQSVQFWYSDNAVVEQLKTVGVTPMLVPAAVVEHIQSVTLRQQPNQRELTTGQAAAFNERYGATKEPPCASTASA